MAKGITGEVRNALIELGGNGREITMQAVAERLKLDTKKEKHPMYRVFRELRRASELKKIRPGVYVYAGKQGQKPALQQVVWKLMRARRIFTVADIEELSGAHPKYIQEIIRLLIRNDIVKEIAGGRFRMIKDPVILPRDRQKIERLREIHRLRKDGAMAALTAAQLAISRAMQEVTAFEIEEPEEEGEQPA